ncbi:MAG: hypothetical protein U0K72_09420, partial [Lachnospiraceae bacterium]|nr:hypothetical protein [Lachnospiraceae bacterium]
MSGYSWISGISIFCYLFLLVSFVSSKSKERVIRAFSFLLLIMILWNGGSVGMRVQLFPSVYFWHHVSLLGIFLLPFGYYQFMMDFLDQENTTMRHITFVFFILLFLVNCATGFFIPLPQVIQDGDRIQFLYHYGWPVYVLIACFVVLHFGNEAVAVIDALPIEGNDLVTSLKSCLLSIVACDFSDVYSVVFTYN